MPARWLQQKKLKQKRMRRAWAKRYSMKNAGPLKAVYYKNEQGKPVEVSLSAANRAARNTLDMYLLTKFKFNPNSPEALYIRTHGLHSDIASQQLVLAKQAQSKENAGSLQGEKIYVYSRLIKIPNHELRLYMCSDSCFFLEEMVTNTHRVFKMSVEYTARHLAMDDYQRKRILWDVIERIPLPPKADDS